MAIKFDTSATFQRMTDVASGEEALISSIQNLESASGELLDHLVDGEEVMQVLDNLSLAMTAVKSDGLSKGVLSVFNSEGELSGAAGQECLTVAGLESLGAAQIKKLEAAYSEGLEGKMAQYWNKFIEWLKQLWAKFVNWIKGLFVRRAHWVKALKELKPEKGHEWDGSLKVDAITRNQYVAVWNQFVDSEQELLNIAQKDTYSGKDMKMSAVDKKTSEGEIGKKGWATEAAWKKDRDEFLAKIGKSKAVDAAQKKIDKVLKWCIDEAKNAGNYEGKKLEDARKTIKEQRELAVHGMQAVRANDALAAFMAQQLYKIGKKGYSQGKSKK